MVYQKINPDRKQQALYLFLEEGWDIEQVAAALGVSQKSIWCWEENYDIHGCVNPPTPLRGRPRLLTDRMTEELRVLITENPSLLLDEIGEWLVLYHDQPILTTTLHDNLKDLGLTYKQLKRVTAERNDGYRSD
jgi:transposase